MKNQSFLAPVLALCLIATLATTHAQMRGPGAMMGGQPGGPNLGGAIAKLFGDNSTFSASLDIQTMDTASSNTIVMPGKVAFDQGKSRFEIDMSNVKGINLPAQAAVQIKAMGMDTMVMLSRPDKKVNWLLYPGLNAYTETAISDAEAAATPDKSKLELTELGKETVDGHPCVKHKAVVTNDKGEKHESTVWNATDLKNFPVKIESTENGRAVTMLFKDVKLSKVEAGQFDVPADGAKYDNYMSLMQQEMMKRAMRR